MSDLGYEAEPVLGQLKDFQRASVEHAFHQLFDLGADRFLVADEVGLGKTMVARGCLLYTSDAAEERSSVALGGRRIHKKKKKYR